MLEIGIATGARPPRVLLLGAHCDDIEIGCGGTVMQLARRYPGAQFMWITLSSDAERAAETRNAAARILEGATTTTVRVEEFKGSYFPYCGPELKDYFEGLKEFRPDLILTHCRDDYHQDHRVTNELTWNTFRDHLILEYEVPKYDGDIGRPSMFVALTRDEMKRKCDVLLECFPSQAHRRWFTRDTFESLARLRGIECNAAEGYAEAFYARKARLGL
jgi:LmbE family N-acetylglucosaminyl deacetylase